MNAPFLIRRLLAALPALFGATLLAFVLGVVVPGDPALEALRQGPSDTPRPEAVAELRRQWGLDQPLPVQYLRWLGRVLQGDLGTSYFSRRPVSEELQRRLPATVVLALASTATATMGGLSLGIICAVCSGWLDRTLRVGSVLLASLPGFLISMLLIAVFAEVLRLTPTSGYGTLAHLVLPTIALSIGETARLLRLTRTHLRDVLEQEYIRTARSKGLNEQAIILHHALPNTLLHIITMIGLHLGAILGGAAIIETIFAWPGVGRLAVEAISRQDYPVVQGFVLLSATVIICINLGVDMLYGMIDPRIRVGRT